MGWAKKPLVSRLSSFCRTVVPAQANASNCRWRHSPVTWRVTETPDEFTDEEYADIVRLAFAAWEAICGLRTKEAKDDERPNIVFLARRIDGRNGVLAEAQLPCGNVTSSTQLWCRVDVGEDWRNYKGPLHSGLMDILRVLMHEIGHLLGISHEKTAAIIALMDPTVQNVRAPQDWDINEAQLRYGPPSDTPPDDGDLDLTPLFKCLRECIDDNTADAVNFGWEAFKRRLTSVRRPTDPNDADSSN